MGQVILLLVLWMSFAVTCDAANLPDCIKTLAKASEVYCDIPGESANANTVYGAYKQACRLLGEPKISRLSNLCFLRKTDC